MPRSPALNARLNVSSSSLRVSVVIRMLTVDIVGSWFGLTSSSLPTMSITFPEDCLSPEGFLKVYSCAGRGDPIGLVVGVGQRRPASVAASAIADWIVG